MGANKIVTDVSFEADVLQKYGVLAVPTMHAFSGGQVVRQVTGARSKSALLRDFAGIL
jgi:thioredoxin 1